jgi:predicted nucleotidyltransferase
MQTVEVIKLLRQHRPDLERLGIDHLYLFGSTARGEARDDSDIDLFFDHQRGELGLYQLMDIKELASSILGRPTDIMTRSSLHPVLRPQIEASALRVF